MDTTRGRQRPSRSEFRLTLYPSRDRTEWRLTRITWSRGEPTYLRLQGGALGLPVGGARGLLTDFARVVWELRRIWRIPLEPQAPREPLGGGGGDVPLPHPDLLHPVSSWPLKGDDTEPPEDYPTPV